MKAKRVKHLDPAGPLAENAARIVLVRTAELRKLAAKALRREAGVIQHDTRIAAKRLRYVLELNGFCFGRPAVTARNRTKELQDLLGEIHDCDVMLPRLAAHRLSLIEADVESVRERAADAADLEPEMVARAPHRTSYRGIDVLEVHLRARRALLFDRFAERWRDGEERGVWRALERAAESEIERAAEARRAAERAERARSELASAELEHRSAADRAARAAAELAEAEREAG